MNTSPAFVPNREVQASMAARPREYRDAMAIGLLAYLWQEGELAPDLPTPDALVTAIGWLSGVTVSAEGRQTVRSLFITATGLTRKRRARHGLCFEPLCRDVLGFDALRTRTAIAYGQSEGWFEGTGTARA